MAQVAVTSLWVIGPENRNSTSVNGRMFLFSTALTRHQGHPATYLVGKWGLPHGANTCISVHMAYTFQILSLQFSWIPALRTHFLQEIICYRKVAYTKYARLQ